MSSYREDFIKLTAAFPKGTVIETSPHRAHIPVQVYQKRLEDVLGEQWQWRILEMPQIDYQAKSVLVKGELQIHRTARQAMGYSVFKTNEPNLIKSAIAIAEADAFRNCCDYFQMGWVDLAPYREWSKNPAISLTAQQEAARSIQAAGTNKHTCLICHNPLLKEDELFLELHQIQLKYCSEHVPKHFLKSKE